MDSGWKNIQSRLIEGNQDFKTISLSILNLVEALKDNYNFKVYFSDRPSAELNNQGVLNSKMQQYLEQSKDSYITEQRRVGRSISADFDSFLKSINDENERKKLLNYVKFNAWNQAKGYFLETLCLLTYLNGFQSADSKQSSYLLFTKESPIPISDNGKKRFLWYQPTVKATKTEMIARPDIVITSSEKEVSNNTIINLTECKCREQFTVTDVRREFGKAFDLRVDTFSIVVFYNISDRLKKAANQLGIELIELGLYTPERERYIKQEKFLEEELSYNLFDSYRSGSFSKMLSEAAISAIEKSES